MSRCLVADSPAAAGRPRPPDDAHPSDIGMWWLACGLGGCAGEAAGCKRGCGDGRGRTTNDCDGCVRLRTVRDRRLVHRTSAWYTFTCCILSTAAVKLGAPHQPIEPSKGGGSTHRAVAAHAQPSVRLCTVRDRRWVHTRGVQCKCACCTLSAAVVKTP